MLTTRLNGMQMQRSGTDLLIYSIPQIIAFCSDFTPLSPGDIIATGTPEGGGHRRTPPRRPSTDQRLRPWIRARREVVEPVADRFEAHLREEATSSRAVRAIAC